MLSKESFVEVTFTEVDGGWFATAEEVVAVLPEQVEDLGFQVITGTYYWKKTAEDEMRKMLNGLGVSNEHRYDK